MNKIILFGTGSSSKKIDRIINKDKNMVIAYVDNNVEKQGLIFNGLPVYNPSKLIDVEFDFVIICSIYFTEIYQQLVDIGINQKKIIDLFRYVRYNDVKLKLLELEGKKEIQAIITGMSYARYGFNSETLKLKSVNLAFNSQDIFYDYCLSQYVIENFSFNIKYALVGLSYFSFHFDLVFSKEKHLLERYSIIKGIQKKINLQKYNMYIKENEISGNLFSHDLEYMNEVFIDKFLEQFDLLDQNSKNTKNLIEDQVKLARIHSSKNYPKTVQENKEYLNSYLKMLFKNNIIPIFVIHPQALTYRENFQTEMIKEFQMILDEFKSKYNIKEVNLFSSEEFSNKDFFDVHHLNSRGAKKVSLILNKYLEK